MNDFKKGDRILSSDGRYPEDALVVVCHDTNGDVTAFPLGGGVERQIDGARSQRFTVVTDGETTPIYREAQFCIEDSTTFPGWTDGTLWNGWAKPLFTRDTAFQVVQALAPDVVYNPGIDAFVAAPLTPGDDPETWDGGDIDLPDGGTVRVYPVGAGSWIWDEL